MKTSSQLRHMYNKEKQWIQILHICENINIFGYMGARGGGGGAASIIRLAYIVTPKNVPTTNPHPLIADSPGTQWWFFGERGQGFVVRNFDTIATRGGGFRALLPNIYR